MLQLLSPLFTINAATHADILKAFDGKSQICRHFYKEKKRAFFSFRYSRFGIGFNTQLKLWSKRKKRNKSSLAALLVYLPKTTYLSL